MGVINYIKHYKNKFKEIIPISEKFLNSKKILVSV